MSESITTTTARCFCQSFTLTITFPTSTLPKPNYLCLCTTCRKTTGSLCYSDISLPPSTSISPDTLSTLKSYKTSPSGTRYFCSTCSAHCLFHDATSSEWRVSTALLDRIDGIIQWKGTKYAADTGDGGISIWMREIGERKVQHFPDGDECSPLYSNTASARASRNPQSVLPASCHCKTIQFQITRPDSKSASISSPYPDLTHPYHNTPPSILRNPHDEKWWLRPSPSTHGTPPNPTSPPQKYLSGLCTCPSCLLTSGSPFQPWSFIPLCNLQLPSCTPLILSKDGSNLDGLRIYTSKAPSTHRGFCAKCGATVFWFSSAEREELVDVSVGLLAGTGEEGARVEDWLEWWTERVSFSEMAGEQLGGEVLVQGVERGLKEWAREKTVSGG